MARLCLPDAGACRPCQDADGDGYGVGEECQGIDCDDTDPTVFAGAAELCDGLDNDCDSRADEGDIAVPDDVACRTAGVCVGTAPVCRDDAWRCDYPAGYEADAEATCDTLDNDCDGQVDEDFDLATDPRHCGDCGTACAYEHAAGICAERICGLGDCDAGWHDADGDPANGCEYACQVAGDEVCNGRDDDCDGRSDEGFDLQRDPSHCGRCDRACVTPNATPACVEGDCAIEACNDGRWDNNQQVADGCEYACLVTRGGVEACDEIDNDCNGTVDDGFDLSRDPANCGQCGFECDFPQAVEGCVQGQCVIASCEAGFVDLNDDPEDGCELACTPTPDPREICDTVDNDCDGVTDEGFDLAGDEANCGACGRVCAPAAAVGQCRGGVCRVAGCDPGFLDLDGQAENGCEYACVPAADGVELCNLRDDDCDGRTDEDYDLAVDPRHCGRCDVACAYPNGVPACEAGRCALGGCERGFHDLDRDPANGCEYGPCVATNGGVEICDAIDNDCDGTADEGFDLRVDLAHCRGLRPCLRSGQRGGRLRGGAVPHRRLRRGLRGSGPGRGHGLRVRVRPGQRGPRDLTGAMTTAMAPPTRTSIWTPRWPTAAAATRRAASPRARPSAPTGSAASRAATPVSGTMTMTCRTAASTDRAR
ncbi:MAG: putative metal-binding motif-containing protein [bacterium]